MIMLRLSVRNFSLVHGIFAPSAWAGVTVATRALHASLRASYRHAAPFLHTARALLALFLLASGSLAFAQTASFNYAITTMGGGFGSPDGVAVDGSGNVYVADYGNNAVKEMPAGCASSSCVTTLGGGFGYAGSVAVDGSGNVYIADYDNNAVKEMPAGCASSSCVTSLGGGFGHPSGVAVDGSGNVYVADIYNDTVKEMPAGCASSNCVTALGGGFGGPFGVAVDGSGNVYVADTYNDTVKEMPAGCASSSCVTTLGGGFNWPYGVAVDGSGSVYVADEGNSAVKEMPAGCTSSSCVTSLGGGFGDPRGVAVDGSGNVYVADEANNLVSEIMTREVNLFTVPVGTASAAMTLTFTFESAGSLSSTTPYQVLTQGAASLDFNAAATQGSNVCNGTTPYTTGETCTVNVTFAPTKAGPRNGAVELLNAGGSTIATTYLYGTGTGPQVVFTPATQTTLGGGFDVPAGLAVDGSSNVYVADLNNNSVKEMPTGCASSSCVTALGGGFSLPGGVAVDGGGNVYVADFGNSAVKEMPAGCATSSCVTTLGGGFNYPWGVAVDGSGNVYVGDVGNNAVKEMPAGCASSSCVTTLGGGFLNPYGVAVDGSGNVYVANGRAGGSNAVQEMPAGCASSSCVTTLGGGFNEPVGVAVDSSGNVYVGDNELHEMPAGCASSSCVTTLGGGFNSGGAVALDGSGNVFAAGLSNGVANAVKELNRAAPPSLSFATTAVGSTSSDSPQTVQVANIGNQPLIFAADVGSNPGYPANFPKNTSDTNLCASGTPLAQGTSCDVSMSFEPTAAGALAGSVLLTDNNLNQTNAAQRIALSETGIGVPAVTTPAPGSTLASSSATFTWTTGVGVTQYVLGIGSTGVGSYNLFNSTPITATQASVTGLPTDGTTLYARLYSWINGAWQYNDYTYTATGGTPAVLTSPTPGSALTSSSATFQWTAGTGVTQYVLGIGSTGVGSYDLFNSTPITITQASVTGLPTNNGETLYARLFSWIDGAWQHHDYTYTAGAVAAELTSPIPGSTLTSSSVTFQWTAGSGVTQYVLGIGSTGAGSYNLYNSTPITATQASVTGLPTNGETLYARLFSWINGAWQHNDYTYTATGGTPAVLTSPTPGSTLTSSSATFQWTAGTGVTQYVLGIGNTGVGSYNLFNSTPITATQASVTGLPINGPLYARLYFWINGAWQYNDYTYTAGGTAAPAILTSPTPGSTLTSSSATFQWTAGSGVTQYVLGIGSTGVGSYNLYNSTPITATQASVTGLPINGETLYARIYSMINGAWQYHDYTYIAAATPAVLTSPTPGSALTSSSATFQWTSGTGVTQYVLGIGSTGVGSYNLFNSTPITATQVSVSGLPTNGGTLYARIYSLINGAWQYHDYTYTAAATPAVLTSPTPGSTLTSSSATFQWTAGSGVTQYVLGIGSTGVGSYDLFNSTPITAAQASVTGLPTNGEKLYARLYSWINGAWQYKDYTYTAQ